MIKLFALCALLGLAFAAGYYTGSHSAGQIKKTVTDLSHNVVDTSRGFEQNLRLRQGLLDAKAQVIQAKADVGDRNFGSGAKALAGAVDALERTYGTEGEGQRGSLGPLIAAIRAAKQDLDRNRGIDPHRLDELRRQLDARLGP